MALGSCEEQSSESNHNFSDAETAERLGSKIGSLPGLLGAPFPFVSPSAPLSQGVGNLAFYIPGANGDAVLTGALQDGFLHLADAVMQVTPNAAMPSVLPLSGGSKSASKETPTATQIALSTESPTENPLSAVHISFPDVATILANPFLFNPNVISQFRFDNISQIFPKFWAAETVQDESQLSSRSSPNALERVNDNPYMGEVEIRSVHNPTVLSAIADFISKPFESFAQSFTSPRWEPFSTEAIPSESDSQSALHAVGSFISKPFESFAHSFNTPRSMDGGSPSIESSSAFRYESGRRGSSPETIIVITQPERPIDHILGRLRGAARNVIPLA